MTTRSRIAGVLELVIAAWAVLRFTQARALASASAEAAEVATSAGALAATSWQVLTIVAPFLVGAWLILRGPTKLIDILMRVSLALAVVMFALAVPNLGAPAALASGIASVALAFVCWKLVRDDLRLLGAVVVASAVAGAVSILEALAGERDLGVGGWVDSDGAPLQVLASPAPPRSRLLARDDRGGWCELSPLDPKTGMATVDLPAGRWYLAVQASAPLEPATTLRVLRAGAAGAAPLAA